MLFRSTTLKYRNAAGHNERKDDKQMMFNISINGSSFSENLDEFDSIRSVLLYRLVKTRHDDVTTSQLCISIYWFVFCKVGMLSGVGLFLNSGADLKTCSEVEITKHRNKHSCVHF